MSRGVEDQKEEPKPKDRKDKKGVQALLPLASIEKKGKELALREEKKETAEDDFWKAVEEETKVSVGGKAGKFDQSKVYYNNANSIGFMDKSSRQEAD